MNSPNRLIHETSPYLLQHAYNPVDWYPWGKEAFQKAQKEQKLIFLSIGYSTCHWCHVMEKESFENPEIAKILNQHFVSIKVDREELPDVDHIYMTAIQMMGQQGGWPLNIFLTPDREPITGGTYFPPKPIHGMPSFKEVLLRIIHLWKNEKEKLFSVAKEITQYLHHTSFSSHYGQVQYQDFVNIISLFYQHFDSRKGGFLFHNNNKFPPSLDLLLLCTLYKKTKDKRALNMIEKTIQEMRKGGIYDQIGGGISRYATDHNWHIPHFEKMLYDNALFCWVNIEAYRITHNSKYKEIAIDILNYIFRNLHHPEGGFFSAEDADSEGKEGAFYIWDKNEIVELLRKENFQKQEIQSLLQHWGISNQGNFENKNVLYIANENISKDLLDKARKILFHYREKRPHPHKDEKILTSWNALMISVLCHASLAFQNPEYIQEAEKTFMFIKKYLTTTEDFLSIPEYGFFYRSYSHHKQKVTNYPGTLSDHSLMGSALIDLYKATTNPIYLQYSKAIRDYIIQYFYQEGKFYETREKENFLIIRPFHFYDGVIPSGFSAAIRILVQHFLYGIDREENTLILETILKETLSSSLRNPFAHAYFLASIFRFLWHHQQIVIATTNSNHKSFKQVYYKFGNHILSDTIIAYSFPNQTSPIMPPLLEGKTPQQGNDYSIYICENFSCQLPIQNIQQVDFENIL